MIIDKTQTNNNGADQFRGPERKRVVLVLHAISHFNRNTPISRARHTIMTATKTIKLCGSTKSERFFFFHIRAKRNRENEQKSPAGYFHITEFHQIPDEFQEEISGLF